MIYYEKLVKIKEVSNHIKSPRLINVDLAHSGGKVMSRTNPYVEFKKDRKKILKLWDRFNAELLEEGNLSPYELMMVREWKRIKDLKINACMDKGIILPANVYDSILENQSELVEKCIPVLRNVSQFLTGIPIILILTDFQSNILQVLGDKKVREEAAKYHIVEGSAWREELAGNNGLGTALSRKAPVHIFAAEHYCQGWHSWTCAATPILNPFTSEVIGVVDLTSLEKDFREEALGLSFSLARQIATELKMELEIERIQLIGKYIEYTTRYPGESILVVDRSGNIIRCNDKLRELFSDTKLDEHILSRNGLSFERETIISNQKEKEIGGVYTVKYKRSTYFKGLSSTITPFIYGEFITLNPSIIKTLDNITRISSTDIPVLLLGETGTGKDLVARYIHQQSHRRDGPFVAVNCGAISRELYSSNFFGYEKGAFTGADPKGRKGFFESAHGGTLFLDEVGELPLDIQASLLRVLETKHFLRLGSEQETYADFRIIAATNRQLEEEIQEGHFRPDLYFRLGVAKCYITPLRERQEDIAYLAEHFANLLCSKYGFEKKTISPEALEILKKYEWQGNVRQLKNIIETMLVYSGEIISADDIPQEIRLEFKLNRSEQIKEDSYNLKSNEKQLIIAAIKKYQKLHLVAEELGISRSTLYRKMEELSINYKDYIKTIFK